MGKRGRKPIDPELVNIRFAKVLELVAIGYSIEKAVKRLKLNRIYFYRSISDKQKAELKMTKVMKTRTKIDRYVLHD